MAILDCTLRDGGYYNNWHFNMKFVWDYLQLCNDLHIDFVEIGFRTPRDHSEAGLWRNVPRNSVSQIIERFPNLKIAIMLEAKDFVGVSPRQLTHTLDDLFEDSENISLVRIAFLASQWDLAIKLYKLLNARGMNIALNLMQFVNLSNNRLIEIVEKLAQGCPYSILYFADSFGQLKPQDCGKKMSTIRALCKNKIGFHGHDNLGLVNANILSCISEGVEYVDSTFMGMGRGAGNAKTETVMHLLRRHVAPRTEGDLFVFLQRKMMPLFAKYKWGANNLYAHASAHNIHPSDTIILANEILASPTEYRAALIIEAARERVDEQEDSLEVLKRKHEASSSAKTEYVICPASRVDQDFIDFCELKKIASGDELSICCMGIPPSDYISSIDWFVTNTCENIFSRDSLLMALQDRSRSVFLGPRFWSILRRYDAVVFERALENAYKFESRTGIGFVLDHIKPTAQRVYLFGFGELDDFSMMNKHETKALLNSFPEIHFDLSASPRLAQLR